MKKGLITLLLLPAILVAGCSTTGSSHASTGGTGTIDVPGYSVDQNAQQSKNS